MSPVLWAIIAVMVAFFLFNFVMICPDKLPWRRRKHNDKRERPDR